MELREVRKMSTENKGEQENEASIWIYSDFGSLFKGGRQSCQ